MRDIDLFELGRMENRSQTMFDRRRHILAVTRRMIARSGYQDFSIRELARLAAVSSRTIYNAFGGKDHLIALAIRGYFDDFQARMSLAGDSTTFDGALERQVAVTLRNLALPNYLGAVASIYFSTSVPAEVRQVLLDIGGYQWSDWLRTLRARRQLETWARVETLLVNVSDLQFSVVHNWRQGLFGDDELLTRTLDAVLTTLAGATRGEARHQVLAALRRVHESAPEWLALRATIERQLSIFDSVERDAFAAAEGGGPSTARPSASK